MANDSNGHLFIFKKRTNLSNFSFIAYNKTLWWSVKKFKGKEGWFQVSSNSYSFYHSTFTWITQFRDYLCECVEKLFLDCIGWKVCKWVSIFKSIVCLYFRPIFELVIIPKRYALNRNIFRNSSILHQFIDLIALNKHIYNNKKYYWYKETK